MPGITYTHDCKPLVWDGYTLCCTTLQRKPNFSNKCVFSEWMGSSKNIHIKVFCVKDKQEQIYPLLFMSPSFCPTQSLTKLWHLSVTMYTPSTEVGYISPVCGSVTMYTPSTGVGYIRTVCGLMLSLWSCCILNRKLSPGLLIGRSSSLLPCQSLKLIQNEAT